MTRFDDRLMQMSKPKLLIVDELGYLPFEANAAHLFFQLRTVRPNLRHTTELDCCRKFCPALEILKPDSELRLTSLGTSVHASFG